MPEGHIISAVHKGAGILDVHPQLPAYLPAGVETLIRACVAREYSDRIRMTDAVEALHVEAEKLRAPPPPPAGERRAQLEASGPDLMRRMSSHKEAVASGVEARRQEAALKLRARLAERQPAAEPPAAALPEPPGASGAGQETDEGVKLARSDSKPVTQEQMSVMMVLMKQIASRLSLNSANMTSLSFELNQTEEEISEQVGSVGRNVDILTRVEHMVEDMGDMLNAAKKYEAGREVRA
jgi:hypothetical protein